MEKWYNQQIDGIQGLWLNARVPFEDTVTLFVSERLFYFIRNSEDTWMERLNATDGLETVGLLKE